MTPSLASARRAARGREAVELHPDYRPDDPGALDFATAATDLIADVLHAAVKDGLSDEERSTAVDYLLDRARSTFEGDQEDEDGGS